MREKRTLRNLVLVAIGIGLASGMASSGNSMPLKGKKADESTVNSVATTPELNAAEQRVSQCEAQLKTASKQLDAAKALLKAAQADLKAAVTDRQALRLKHHAAGLVNESGMTPAKAAPVSVASSTSSKTATTSEADALSTTTPDSRMNAGQEETMEAAPNIMLR